MESAKQKVSTKETKKEMKKAIQAEVNKTMEKEMQKQIASSNTSQLKKDITIRDEEDNTENQLTPEEYDNLITSFKYLLTTGETVNAIKLLKDIKAKTTGGDISCVLDDLLPWGNTLYYLFVKGESKEMMNSFCTFDRILPHKNEQEIMDLFVYQIIDVEFAARVNKCNVSKVLYMIIQFSGYNETIMETIFNTYDKYVNPDDLIRHIMFVNITNDIIVYIKAIKDKNLVLPEYITFARVYESYRFMEENPQYSKITKSRLINAINVFVKLCTKFDIMIPSFREYKMEFNKLFNIYDDTHNISKAMNNLCIESYNHIDNALPWGLQAFYPEFKQTNVIPLLK